MRFTSNERLTTRMLSQGSSAVARAWIALALLLLVTCSSGCGSRGDSAAELSASQESSPVTPTPPVRANASNEPLNRDGEIEASELLLERGDLESATSKLKALLVIDPGDVEVIFRLAGIVAQQDDLANAVSLLDSIPADHPEAGIPALGQSADWCVAMERYDDAERRYEKVIELFPEAAEAHRKLAHLFNRQGRRHEAAGHVYELCRQGNIRQDELHSLIHLSDAMYDDPSQQPTQPQQPSAEGDVPYWPIGASGEARRLFMEDKYEEAMMRLHDSVAEGNQPASIVALYGRAAAEAQDDERFHWWLTKTDASTREFAEYWAAVGTYLALQGRPREAARALLEAIDRDPTDLRSIGRLRSELETLGRVEEAVRCEDRWKLLRDISNANNRVADATTPNVESMEKLAGMLDSLDRTLEGVLWRSLAGHYQNLPRDEMLQLSRQLGQLVASGTGYPGQAVRMCNIDPEPFPLPKLDVPKGFDTRKVAGASQPQSRQSQSPPPPAGFENVADAVGLQHAYRVASTRLDYGFSVYQSVGGAVAVIDYDLDGNPDLYFAQGGSDPPDFLGDASNVLYRSHGGNLRDVTTPAAAMEYRYSMGLTVGDWNQDGFPDIVVGNLGANSLLINNGDGTFHQSDMDDGDDKTMMTTSLAMADLTGDTLPDVFELNYIHDARIAQRPIKNDRGEVIASLTPLDFDPGLDRLIVNDGRGQPLFQRISDSESAASAGLGVVVGDFDQRKGNEIFVGNDVYANQLWRRDGEGGPWVDVAKLTGCAYGSNGVKTASMGIAAGDFDRNGWLDLHVTNFQDESVSFYVNDGGSFQDRNVQFGLAAPSSSVLGFGTQAIDYDNDGKLDLVVTNGHIEKAITISGPFEQPAQMFANLGGRFESVNVVDPSGYWKRNHLGRGLARLDFDRDGRMDFVVTHLGEQSALLLNRTPTTNHWLQLALVGVSSERDAIGAKVQVHLDQERLTEWVVAGDGFLCHNEAVIAFGLGDAEIVDEVTITWPSGNTQTIRNLAADRRWLVIEDQPDPFEL